MSDVVHGPLLNMLYYDNYLGDRLTDERMQAAQKAMANGETQLERLQGFVSKIEDFHRLMNFLEVFFVLICIY